MLATLGFFPLLDALATTPAWLHWTAFDSIETAAAWTVTAMVVGLTMMLAGHIGGRRGGDAVTILWLLVGIWFAMAALTRLQLLDPILRAHRANAVWVVGALAIMLTTVGAWAVLRPGQYPTSRVQRTLAVLWPLSFLFAFHLLRAPSLAERQLADLSPTAHAVAGLVRTQVAHREPRTVVLLFDELSVDYLYGQRATDLSAWPSLALLRAEATLHHDAHLPGGGTLSAIPALFGATTAAPDGLVNALNRQGQSLRIWGWYHDYCRAFAREADECHATSIYNPRTLHSDFSIIDPWWTNIVLLPAEFPFKYLKSPAAVALHRDTLAGAQAWLATQLADPSADFIYAHVNVPHLPLIGEQSGGLMFSRAFEMTEQSYLTQFGAVDDVVAQALISTTRPTRLIVMSDHNARALLPKERHDQVVLVVLEPGLHNSGVVKRENAAETLAHISLGLDETP
ncbi:hypothetical protein LRH25_14730 [Ideonella azotifigens]|uniref:hypothetical protein n=1 Tax=Ideonella azotifigens TaxID=513160 RepID=UPI0014772981|nr:hypothetical protein [Ideonella azotifigens]MCD2341597.1 hypothetical protein [Ideonella azotifigens]